MKAVVESDTSALLQSTKLALDLAETEATRKTKVDELMTGNDDWDKYTARLFGIRETVLNEQKPRCAHLDRSAKELFGVAEIGAQKKMVEEVENEMTIAERAAGD